MALCPECQQTLVHDDNCGLCGWTRAQLPDKHSPDRPPMPGMSDAYSLVQSEIEQYRGPRPEQMPTDNRDAARWLLARVIDRHHPEEAPELKSKTLGSGDRATVKWFWVWPYLTRIKIQSHQFLRLSPDFQRYIIAAREDGIPWRGEDESLLPDGTNMFRRVVAEHQRMQEVGPEAYRKEAMAKMRGILASVKKREAA